MIYKKVTIQEILQFLSDKVLQVHGPIEGVYINNLAEVDRVNETTLDWINPSKPNKQEIAENSKAHVLLVNVAIQPVDGKTLIVVNNPKVALAEIGNHFFVEKVMSGIHPTVIIHPEAMIGNNCHIGPYTVIGKAIIGDNCIIDAHVRIYDDVVMGHDCVIKSGAVLGGAGFGYERDEEGNKFRFPQIGQLILGDYVDVGSNSTIDRGSLSDTTIGHHTKISSNCLIAHNNKIGCNVTITGNVMIAGSNVIDDNVWIAPNASIRGWVHIGESAVVGMSAVVINDIPAHETWVGNPAHKLEKK